MAKNKYYVVWRGVEPGIYHSWADCQLQIKGYPGAHFKSFKTLDEAKSAWSNGDPKVQRTSTFTRKKKLIDYHEATDIIKNSWCVDAACSGNPGVMEYRGVHTMDGSVIFHQKFDTGTNNIGEFLALVHALALLRQSNNEQTAIYTDSKTAISWVKNKKAKTTLKKDDSTAILYDRIYRAEKWLSIHPISNKIIKWNTDRYGDIPADFGRK